MAANSTPALQEATSKSTTVWRQDLEALFNHTKDRFPDVVWELGEGDGDEQEVWGHKALRLNVVADRRIAIVYARAPPSFQSRPAPYASSPPPTTSALSLDLSPSRTPSPTQAAPTNTLLRLSSSITPAIFSNELEYLYTGQGFGEAFEFLYDSAESTPDEGNAEELRIDKLRKDLVFMWRSRLFSDVRISLNGNFSSSNHENTTAIFSSHRFILVSRSPYFHTALLGWSNKTDTQMLTLPSPPFTPASLHFTLGFIYTGTLIFSHRSYDLDTAFHIMRSATYLSLPTLYDEIQARIVQEMMHGLFHAFLPFPEYERLTGGAWGTGGCRCRQCARRAPRVLEFSLLDDVKNTLLERGARRALVGLFGEGWCTSEFAALPAKLRDSLLKGVGKRTTPKNAFALLCAAEHALGRLGAIIDAWSGDVKEMILVARKGIDEVVCTQPEACFTTPEWNDIMERDGVAFEDAERVEWFMASVLRGVNDRNAGPLYQTLVSSILLRPHATETDAPMLSSTSHVRVQVEQTRLDLLKWIGKRWLGVRQQGGFDELEGWAIKEIGDAIEVPIEDLFNAASQSPLRPHNPPRQSTLLRAKETASNSDTISMHSSMRMSIHSRPVPKSRRDHSPLGSSVTSTSYKSMTRVNASTTSLARNSPLARDGKNEGEDEDMDNSRPDSKLTPALDSIGLPPYKSRSPSPTPQPSIVEPDDDGQSRNGDYDDRDQDSQAAEDERVPNLLSLDHNQLPPAKKVLIKKVAPATQPSSSATTKPRPPALGSTRASSSVASIRSSASSVRSVASTIRKSTVIDANKNLRLPRTPTTPVSPTSPIRPTSRGSTLLSNSTRPSSRVSVSTTSDASTAFRTAPSTVPRSRRTSGASVASTVSTAARSIAGREPSATPRGAAKAPIRTRTTSTGSTKSNVSTRSGVSVRSTISTAATTPKRRPPVPPVDASKLSPTVMKRSTTSSSAASVRSTASTVSTAASTAARKAMTNAGRKVGNGGVTPAEKVKEMAMAREREKEQTAESSINPPTNPTPSPSLQSLEMQEPILVQPAVPNSDSTITIKPKTQGDISLDHKKNGSTASTGSTSTLRRRGSSDTITTRMSMLSNSDPHRPAASQSVPPTISEVKALKENQPLPTLPIMARGATLDIGIPCIISSKRKRFKAYARYIGEVEGEDGPWVGVEVPVSDGADRDDGERQWNDGTWGGVRYFEIGNSCGSEWDYGGDDRASRRRRMDWVGSASGSIFGGRSVLKREADQLSLDHRAKRFRSVSPAMSDASGMESRGLFVRPQQSMKVVASTKLAKALQAGKEDGIANAEVFAHSSQDPTAANKLFVVISSDKGLCCGIHRFANFSNMRLTFNHNISTFADAAGVADLIVKRGVKYDSVVLVYNKFVSAISYQASAMEVKGKSALKESSAHSLYFSSKPFFAQTCALIDAFKTYENEDDGTKDLAESSLSPTPSLPPSSSLTLASRALVAMAWTMPLAPAGKK
ncbi:hypothetical protein H0H92_008690 [Tricholoma furcatifolium]|nr:hypothetical protein H0H92_008690 [Tricholoma furcatifolium]